MTKLEIEHGEGRAELDRQHHDTTNEIYQRGKLTLTLRQFISGIFLMIVVLSLIGRATSGRFWFYFDSRAEAERLSREVNRKDTEIDQLGRKLGYKNETLLIFQGIALDNPNFLERSRTSNPNRTEPFEFVNWMMPDELVAFMFRNESFNCLAWVMKQNKWYSCLNERTYKELTEWEAKAHQNKLKRTVKKSFDYGPVYFRKL